MYCESRHRGKQSLLESTGPAHSTPSVQLPNGEIIHSTANAQLPLSPELSKCAKQALILPKLSSSNLVSVGQLCDDGCEIILNKYELTAIKNNKVIVKGYRNKHDGLWDIPIHKKHVTTKCCISPPIHPSLHTKRTEHDSKIPSTKPFKPKKARFTKLVTNTVEGIWEDEINHQLKYNALHKNDHKLNVILRKKQTHVELASYLHAACFSPVPSTFIKAIKKDTSKAGPVLHHI